MPHRFLSLREMSYSISLDSSTFYYDEVTKKVHSRYPFRLYENNMIGFDVNAEPETRETDDDGENDKQTLNEVPKNYKIEDFYAGCTKWKEEIEVRDLVLRYRNTTKPFEYSILETEMSEMGKKRAEYHKKWELQHKSGRRSDIGTIIKDAGYDSIRKERSHLYHRIEKIKKWKHSTEEEKQIEIEKIRERLSVLAAQVKHLPRSKQDGDEE